MALTIGELVGFIRADGSDFERGLARSQLRMEGFQVGVDGRLRDLSGNFADETRTMARAMADSFSDAERQGTRITTVYSSVADAQSRTMRARFQQIQGAARRMGSELQRVWGRARDAFDRINFDRLKGLAAGIGRVAATVGPMAAKLGAAVPLAAGLAAAVGNIAPAAGVAVTGLVAIQLATKAVKLGMVGVEDAVTAALDPEKAEEFAEAIKKLAPEAQKFAKGIKALAPEFKKLQQDVQNRIFMGLDGVLKNMSRTTLPVLRKALVNSGDAINQMVKGVGSAASRLAADGVLGKAVSGAVRGLHNLQRIPGQITLGLGQVAAAGAPAFARLTKAAGSAMDRLSAKLTSAFKSGAMEKAIENAITLIGELFAVAKNVASILGSVFKAAQVSGGGFIGMLKEITGAMAKAFASPEVQAGLRQLFETMAELAKMAAPILIVIVKTLAGVFERLGPPVRELIQHLGVGLLKVVTALSPVVLAAAAAFGELVSLTVPFIDLAADLITALLPALTPLFETLSTVLQQAMPFVQQLATSLGALLLPVLNALATSVMPALMPFFVQLAQRIFPLLTETLIKLTPSLTQLGLALAQLLVELSPLIARWLEMQIVLLDKLMPILLPLIELLTKLASGALTALARAITDFVIPAVQAIVALLNGDFSGALSHAKALVRNFAVEAVVYLTTLKDRGSQAMHALAGAVGRHIITMGQNAVRGTLRMVGEMVAAVRSLPGRIRAALPGPSGILYGIGQAIIRGLINGIKSQIGALAGQLQNITSMIPDWKGPAAKDAKLLTPAGRSLMEGFQRGIAGQLPALRSQLQGITGELPGMAMGAMSASPGAPGGAGQQRVLIEFRGPQWLRDAIREVVQVDGRGSVEVAFGQP